MIVTGEATSAGGIILSASFPKTTNKISLIRILRISPLFIFTFFLLFIHPFPLPSPFIFFYNTILFSLYLFHQYFIVFVKGWLLPAMFSGRVCRKFVLPGSYTCLLLMTATWTARSLNGCSKSRLAKVKSQRWRLWVSFFFFFSLGFWWLFLDMGFGSDGGGEWKQGSAVSGVGWRKKFHWSWCEQNANLAFELLKALLFSVLNNRSYLEVMLMLLFWWLFRQSVKVNLIMTDYSMPGMTGYELLKKIKVRNETWSFLF